MPQGERTYITKYTGPHRFNGRLPQVPKQPLQLADPRLHRAACTGHAGTFDERAYEESDAAFKRRLKRARAICQTCPVIQACAQAALDLPRISWQGIWAGQLITPQGSDKKLQAIAEESTSFEHSRKAS